MKPVSALSPRNGRADLDASVMVDASVGVVAPLPRGVPPSSDSCPCSLTFGVVDSVSGSDDGDSNSLSDVVGESALEGVLE